MDFHHLKSRFSSSYCIKNPNANGFVSHICEDPSVFTDRLFQYNSPIMKL
jgi:hypothetical protein